jgi:hypothetical protein
MEEDQRDEERNEEKDGETSDAEGAKRDDIPDPGKGTGEGERGLGTQTGAAGGGKSDPMRGRNPTGEGAASRGGAPNEETRDD